MKKLLTMCALIISLLVFPLAACLNVAGKYPNADKYLVGENEIFDEITDIEVNWISGKVTVEQYDGESIRMTETATRTLISDEEMRYLVDGTTLRIQFCKSGLNIKGVLNKNLTLQVPEDCNYRSVNIETVSAAIEADVKATNAVMETVSGKIATTYVGSDIKLETVSGKVELSCGAVRSIDTSTVSGAVDVISDSSDEILISTTSGRISVTTKQTLAMAMNTVSGSVNLNIPFKMGYRLSYDTVSGSLRNNIPTKQYDNDYVNGDGATKISVSTTSGSLTVNGMQE